MRGYEPFLSSHAPPNGPTGPRVSSQPFGSPYCARRSLCVMETLPSLLLGGTNLVRTLGHAGIPAIVASNDPDEPGLSSRYCSMPYLLPPLSRPEAVIDALLELGARLFTRYGRQVPLF